MNELTQLEQQKDDFYCYDVLYRLFSIWQLILKNNVPQKKSLKNLAALRTQQFLQYIECHYHESLTLNRLAASAHVSPSECLRCFKHTLQTTPYKYLMDYRLLKATNLLTDTMLPISQIALLTGFNQQSYFGKSLKEKMGISPRIYRQNMQKNMK